MDAERILGSILRNALTDGGKGSRRRRKRRKSSLFGLNKAQIGMGVLAGAFAAFEHYSNKQKESHAAPTPPPPPSTTVVPPPPPPTQTTTPTLPPPPPPPPTQTTVQTPPPPPPVPGTEVPPPPPVPDANETAKILIRAMISAAAADGEIDADESAAIWKKVEEGGVTDEERQFLENEMRNPLTVDQVAAQVHDPGTAQQVYIASLLAIEVDTDDEREHMSRLASLLGLDSAMVSLLHQATGD